MEYKFKDKYKTISEVVKLLNMNTQKKSNNHTHTLRYWEKEFKQVKPIKTNKRRYYDQKNIDILLKIQYLLKNQGMTIKGVKKFLNNNILDIDENEKKIINSLNIKFRLNKINNLLKNFKKN